MSGKKQGLIQCLTAALMAVLVFLSGFQGTRAIMALPTLEGSSWQDTMAFEHVLSRYLDKVMILVNSYYNLEEEQLNYVQRQQLRNSVREQLRELDGNNTWFRYEVKSSDGRTSYYSNSGGDGISVQTVHYAVFDKEDRVPGEGIEFETYDYYEYEQLTPTPALRGTPLEEEQGDLRDTDGDLVIEYGVQAEPLDTVRDDFYTLYTSFFSEQASFSYWAVSSGVLAVMAGVCLLTLLILSGHQALQKDFRPIWLDRIWLELFLCLAAGVLLAALWGVLVLGNSMMLYHYNGLRKHRLAQLLPWAISGLAALMSVVGAGLLRTLVVRGCSRTLGHSSLLYRLLLLTAGAIRNLWSLIPAFWHVLLGCLLLLAVNAMAFMGYPYPGWYVVLWAGVNGLALLWLFWWLFSFLRLQRGSKTIAEGNLSHQIDTRKMPAPLKEHGEALNNISQGLSSALDEKIKSERFKAELITNVSHDLKTPLTSIINYVNLLKTTDQTDPKALEYIEVLDRKSQRLKKLTEDLVEASKASTGVLSVQREKIGLGQLVSQAMGEWEERLNARSLTVVITQPEGESWVYADGRHLWRVIDNLLSNCCKYAMEGTRIYLDLVRNKGKVELSVKNISREQLNIPPEQLMKRFVRGEESRTTEGSGLGLSIARSLTELQGGTFELKVDGDLFKAVVTLPQAG